MSSFDAQHPPDPKLMSACVHCGFCLTTCPSYRVLGQETDSPRGRIYQMSALSKGEIPLGATTVSHFDTCLGCLACTTACPSEVAYDQLLAATRPQIERNFSRTLPDRLIRGLIFSLFPYPKRLRTMLYPLVAYQKLGLRKVVRATGLLQRLSPRLAAMEAILPDIPASAFRPMAPGVIPAQGKERYRVAMILGCVQQLLFDRVNQATVRVLTANGCTVTIPVYQGCCAALPSHQGQLEQAQDLARQMIDAFDLNQLDAVIINAAGCGHTLKEYGHMLADDPAYGEKAKLFVKKVKDIHEFLAQITLVTPLSSLSTQPLPVVYQDACHLLHGQKISLQPRQLLRQIPGIKLKEPLDNALCCGSAGVYNLLQPEIAEELGTQKVNNLLATGAQVIASPNPGCALHITKHLHVQGHTVAVFHPIELLDYAIRGVALPLDPVNSN